MIPDMVPDEKSLEPYGEYLKNINQIRRRVADPLIAFRKRPSGAERHRIIAPPCMISSVS